MKSSSICLLHIPGMGSKPGEVPTVTAEDKLNKGVPIFVLRSGIPHPPVPSLPSMPIRQVMPSQFSCKSFGAVKPCIVTLAMLRRASDQPY